MPTAAVTHSVATSSHYERGLASAGRILLATCGPFVSLLVADLLGVHDDLVLAGYGLDGQQYPTAPRW